MSAYAEFLNAKLQAGALTGFTPTFVPAWLFDFQADLVEWARVNRELVEQGAFDHLRLPQGANGGNAAP